jgi:glycine cleavage system regulatory protein
VRQTITETIKTELQKAVKQKIIEALVKALEQASMDINTAKSKTVYEAKSKNGDAFAMIKIGDDV